MTKNLPVISLKYSHNIPAHKRPLIKTHKQAATYFLKHWDKDKIELQEEFKAIFLDRAMRAIGIVDLATGGKDGVYVDIGLLLGAAITANTHFLVLAHSHPSGDTTPSYHDKLNTYQVSRACAMLGIGFMDHLVLNGKSFSVCTLDQGFYKEVFTREIEHSRQKLAQLVKSKKK